MAAHGVAQETVASAALGTAKPRPGVRCLRPAAAVPLRVSAQTCASSQAGLRHAATIARALQQEDSTSVSSGMLANGC
jgi:hypothetical protein